MELNNKGKVAVNMVGKCFFAQEDQISWIVDSGAIDHITDNKNLLLLDDKVVNTKNVLILIGDTTTVSHIRNCQLIGGDFLKDVLYVPIFKFNLLSVSKVTKDLNYYAKFYLEHYVF